MKVAVIGLGSMGKRRIRLIKNYDSQIEIIGIDSNQERLKQCEHELNITVRNTVDDLDFEDIDCAFVCTSPLSHSKLISFLIKNNIDVFTEINLLCDGYDEFINEKNVKIFLSSTFLYRRDIQWMIDKVNKQKVNYIYHTGQYLPDWHPWENYNNYFVGDKRTNGCREIMAIELPWITECFGNIKKISVLKDKMSSLKIDYPDNYMLQVEHENGSKGQITIDVVARMPIRRAEIYNESFQIFWEGTPDSLKEWNIDDKDFSFIKTYDEIENNNKYAKNIIENAYYDEIKAFFKWINEDKSEVKHSFEKDLEILKLIDEIEGEK